MSKRALPQEFYARDPTIVATELLGHMLIRRLNTRRLEGLIVETEAYSGMHDPASRAAHGRKRYNEPMWNEPGTVFIYNVHRYWMFNVVAHQPNEVGAVLIRALQPIIGIEVMQKNRPVDNVVALTNGPGKLTTALQIDKRFNNVSVTSCKNDIYIVEHNLAFAIGCSHRIGVTKDVAKKLRFFIKGNQYVSK